MSHYEDDFARHHMQAKHKREKSWTERLNANHKKMFKLRYKQDERNMAKLLGSWDDLVIDELKINN